MLKLAKNVKNGKKWILKEYGKRTSWILYMCFLTYGTKCQSKKIWKKMTGRCTFWPGRKMGRSGCRPWKCAKLKKKFSSKSWPLCTVLFIWDWTRAILCSKWPLFNPAWWISYILLCLILSLLSISATLGFPKRYVTLSKPNRLRNDSQSKLKVW